MTAEGLFLLAILGGALVLFYTQWIRTDLTALLVLIAMVVPWRPAEGRLHAILTPQEAFAGFGSTSIILVAAMFVVSAGIVKTGAADLLGRPIFERCAHNETLLQAAVLSVCTVTSAFINDTTVVLIWMPMIVAYCGERGLAPSRYLLAVAYGSLLGGMWTLIGTRSNLVVSEFMTRHTGRGLGFFQFTPIAIAVFAACLVFYLTVGVRLLPRRGPDEDLAATYQVTEFLTEVMITPESAAIGRTLAESRFRENHGVEVIEVLRDGEPLAATPRLRLAHGDVLIVQGPSSKIVRLLKAADFQIRDEMKVASGTLRSLDLVMLEAVVAPNSSLVYRRLKNIDFFEEFGFSVMAVAREGRKIGFRPADVLLRLGDTLLLYGHEEGVERLRRQPDLLVMGAQPFPTVNRARAFAMVAVLAAAVASIAFRVLPAAVAIPLSAVVTVLSGTIKMRDVYGAIDWMAVVVVGGMISYGTALEKTHTAEHIAGWALSLLVGMSPTLLLAALLALALALTQLIENTAVAIILCPIALSVCTQAGLPPEPVLLALAITVSAAFMTPVAHESTILVMGPGRYQFRDYLRLGTVFALLTWLIVTAATSFLYRLG